MQSKYAPVEKGGCCSCRHSMCLGSINSASALQSRVVSNPGAKYSVCCSAWTSFVLWENAVVERPDHLGLLWRITEPHWECGTTVGGIELPVPWHEVGNSHKAQWLKSPSLVNPYLIYGFNTSFNQFSKYPESFHIIHATTKTEMGNADLSAQESF